MATNIDAVILKCREHGFELISVEDPADKANTNYSFINKNSTVEMTIVDMRNRLIVNVLPMGVVSDESIVVRAMFNLNVREDDLELFSRKLKLCTSFGLS